MNDLCSLWLGIHKVIVDTMYLLLTACNKFTSSNYQLQDINKAHDPKGKEHNSR